MSLNKPSESEDEYFAREEAAKLQRQAAEQASRMQKSEREDRKKLHFMKCPKCGFDLREVPYRGISIDKCFECGGIWLDDQELEHLIGHEGPNAFSGILKLFRAEKPAT